jgi:hypothetical protein
MESDGQQIGDTLFIVHDHFDPICEQLIHRSERSFYRKLAKDRSGLLFLKVLQLSQQLVVVRLHLWSFSSMLQGAFRLVRQI